MQVEGGAWSGAGAVPYREVCGAETCIALPLCREVLRCPGCRMVPWGGEALWRSSGGGAEARARRRAVCQNDGCACV